MIKLQRGDKPEYLTDKMVSILTEKYNTTKQSVWNREQIKVPLSESSNHKCAYCETDLTEPSTYMEVEHFLPKSKYSDLVVRWDNLLPSCKRCNGTKNDSDVLENPIINPFDQDPRAEFCFDRYFIFGVTNLGENTENVLDLNDGDLLLKRFNVSSHVMKEIIKMYNEFRDVVKLNIHHRNRLRAILLAGQSNRPYSAFVSTIIHSTSEYELLKNRFISEEKWTGELEELHQKSLELTLPIR